MILGNGQNSGLKPNQSLSEQERIWGERITWSTVNSHAKQANSGVSSLTRPKIPCSWDALEMSKLKFKKLAVEQQWKFTIFLFVVNAVRTFMPLPHFSPWYESLCPSCLDSGNYKELNGPHVPKVIGVHCAIVAGHITNLSVCLDFPLSLHHREFRLGLLAIVSTHFAKSDLWDFVMHKKKRKRQRKTRNPNAGARE